MHFPDKNFGAVARQAIEGKDYEGSWGVYGLTDLPLVNSAHGASLLHAAERRDLGRDDAPIDVDGAVFEGLGDSEQMQPMLQL